MLKTEMENKKMPKAEITNKSSVPLHGLKPGAKKVIEVDNHNVPKEQHWRRRVRDSKLDNCIGLKPIKVEQKKKKKVKEE